MYVYVAPMTVKGNSSNSILSNLTLFSASTLNDIMWLLHRVLYDNFSLNYSRQISKIWQTWNVKAILYQRLLHGFSNLPRAYWTTMWFVVIWILFDWKWSHDNVISVENRNKLPFHYCYWSVKLYAVINMWMKRKLSDAPIWGTHNFKIDRLRFLYPLLKV